MSYAGELKSADDKYKITIQPNTVAVVRQR